MKPQTVIHSNEVDNLARRFFKHLTPSCGRAAVLAVMATHFSTIYVVAAEGK